jgi:hypothetical protein
MAVAVRVAAGDAEDGAETVAVTVRGAGDTGSTDGLRNALGGVRPGALPGGVLGSAGL